MKFTGICTIKEKHTGRIIEKDFEKAGNKHILTFHITPINIWVEIAGFTDVHSFYFNPNKKQLNINQYFLNKFVLSCDNASEILQYFK